MVFVCVLVRASTGVGEPFLSPVRHHLTILLCGVCLSAFVCVVLVLPLDPVIVLRDPVFPTMMSWQRFCVLGMPWSGRLRIADNMRRAICRGGSVVFTGRVDMVLVNRWKWVEYHLETEGCSFHRACWVLQSTIGCRALLGRGLISAFVRYGSTFRVSWELVA